MLSDDGGQNSSMIHPDSFEQIDDLARRIEACEHFNRQEKELIYDLLEKYSTPKKKKGPKSKSQRNRDRFIAHEFDELLAKGHSKTEIYEILGKKYGLLGSPNEYNNALYKALARGRESNAVFDKFQRIRDIRKMQRKQEVIL